MSLSFSECANCGRIFHSHLRGTVKHSSLRGVKSGDDTGECPVCGALSSPIPAPNERFQALADEFLRAGKDRGRTLLITMQEFGKKSVIEMHDQEAAQFGACDEKVMTTITGNDIEALIKQARRSLDLWQSGLAPI